MEITVMSQEMIKPSSPTPDHLKHLKLSFLDQFTPTFFVVRLLVFYSARGDVHRFQNTNMSHQLKRSLSDVLTKFYPLAGRFNGGDTIECTDRGLEYIEARVKGPLTLNQLLACPKPDELDKLIPHDAFVNGTGCKGLFAAQVTVFEECGSMSIGVNMSHILGDALSLAAFLNSWAATARGDTGILSPKFEFALLFPPRSDAPSACSHDVDHAGRLQPKDNSRHAESEKTRPKLITKRFVFPQLKIDALKAKFKYECPTKVEAVSALVFKCLINMSKSGSSKAFVLEMPINLRTRMSPPLPMQYFGNASTPFKIEHTGPDSLNELGVQIKKSIKEFDGDYMKKLQANDALLLFERLEHQRQPMPSDVRMFSISSLCKFPFDEMDFGWGMPTWVAAFNPKSPHPILLLDAKNGDGIEVWLTLEEDDMAKFESQDEFLDFVCANPVVSVA